MSSYFQQPLSLGADIVIHSTTKYLNGHSGSVGCSIMLNNAELFAKLKFTQNSTGYILSPFDSFLVSRGIKTLALSMQQHEKNAITIANFLQKHKLINKVIYPGLPSHPQHKLAKEQMSSFGGMLSFELKSDVTTTKKFIENLNYFLVAESIGGVESLVEIPALMTHAAIPAAKRKEIGLNDNLIRLSVGIENINDLLADLEQALAKINP